LTQTLTRRERIRRRPDFLKVQHRGVRTRGRYMTLIILANGLDVSRLGIIATRRLGGAVRRNRSKRLVREIYRLNKPSPGLDIVVLPQPDLPDVAFAVLEADYRTAVRRYGRRPPHPGPLPDQGRGSPKGG
jgi:ribonuclease P protein component